MYVWHTQTAQQFTALSMWLIDLKQLPAANVGGCWDHMGVDLVLWYCACLH